MLAEFEKKEKKKKKHLLRAITLLKTNRALLSFADRKFIAEETKGHYSGNKIISKVAGGDYVDGRTDGRKQF